MPFLKKILLCVALAMPLAACAQSPSEKMTPFKTEVRNGIKAMDDFYLKDKGVWHGTDDKGRPIDWWWNSANAINTLVRYVKFSGDKKALSYIETAFEKNKQGRFLNEFYDDEGWWALAWVEAFELTKDKKYLKMAEVIFADMTKGWSCDFGGGIWWKKDHLQKNAIENNLYILLALRLNAHNPKGTVYDVTYREWAEMCWEWYETAGLIRPDGRVADGLRRNGTLNEVFFTYNQGVTMACAIEFYKITNAKKYLELAQKLADTGITRYIDNDTGVLREHFEPHSTQDLAQFKGVFMRHLYTIYEATKDERYAKFILHNAGAIMKNKDPKTNHYGTVWFQPYEKRHYEFAAQSSALDALVSAIGVEKLQKK